MSPRVLVTGGLGFVGKAVVANALTRGFSVCASSRQKINPADGRVEFFQVGDLGLATDWSLALQGVHSVVHCAARAHVLHETAADPHAVFHLVNVDGTLNLARQAAAAGVKRFVYLSSIGVNGAQTAPGVSFSETDDPAPQNAYAQSKWEAEQGLRQIAGQTGLEVVIIRPPLVYGVGAPGNFGALMCAVQKGWPLPLGLVHNQRSLVALDNLVEFVFTCITHPQAANQAFLISDGQDMSTSELVRGMAHAAGRPARLLPVPVWVLQAAATILGTGDSVLRLCGNLQLDISKARNLLDWTPLVTVDEGLRRAIDPLRIP